MISTNIFGTLPDGREVKRITMQNENGVAVEVINYGARITRLLTRNRNNHLSDIVLGYDNIDQYLSDEYYLGAAVGRYANRIAKGKFSLHGIDYQLTLNNGENHLHGGTEGLHQVLWDMFMIIDPEWNSFALKYESRDGESGYPGNVSVHAVFSLNEENELAIHFHAQSDKDTILNLSHHSYFNLSGDLSGSIHDHLLEISADHYTPVDPGGIPTGELASVENTPMDFRKAKRVGDEIDSCFPQLINAAGYDHNWVINRNDSDINRFASLYDLHSGRYMDISTDQPGVQFYAGNFLKEMQGKNGVTYHRRSGLCLETQNFPDVPNHPDFPSAILEAGEIYSRTTVYKFGVM